MPEKDQQKLHFLKGGGEMGAIMRAKDWKTSPLGPPATWPMSLRFAVSTMLHTAFPNFIFWGKEQICLYNDAYRPSLGENGKHPDILGIRGKDAFPEIWDTIGPMLQNVRQNGEPTWSENQLIPFYRNGRVEDIYWTFSYSPLFLEDGTIGGVLTTCMETTAAVTNLKRVEESEDALQFAIDAANLGTWDYDPLNNLVRYNERLKSWFGLEGKSEMGLEDTTIAIDPKDRPRVEKAIARAMDSNTTGQYDIGYRIENKITGQERYVRAMGRAWFNVEGVCYRFNGTLQDNTEQQRAHEERLKLIALIETSQELIGFSNIQGQIEYANPASLKMLGWKNIQGKTVKDCVYPPDMDKAQKALDAVMKKGAHTIELRLHNQRTGAPFWILWNAFLINDPEEGAPIGLGTVSIDIDLQKQREKELELAFAQLQEEKNNFMAMIQQAPVGIALFIGKEHVLESINDRAALLLNGDRNFLLGRPLHKILPEQNTGLLGLLDEVFEKGTTAQQQEVPITLLRNGKKEKGYFNIVFRSFRDGQGTTIGTMAIANEVTQTVLLKQILGENERKFRKMVMQSPIPMAVFRGPDLIIEMANKVMLETFWHREESEVSGRGLAQVFPEVKDQKYWRALQQVLETGKPLSEKESFAYVDHQRGREEFYVDYDYEALHDADGHTTGVMITVNNVTQSVKARKKLEQFSSALEREVEKRTHLLSKANERLAMANKKLKDSNADLESFAYVSSHDLQEPLRKIQMFTSRIAERDAGTLSEKGQRDFDKIVTAASRMRGLIDDLLAFSRANTQELKFERKQLRTLLGQVLEDMDEKIARSGARIHIGKLGSLPVIPYQLRQVFQNLLDNAIKFAKANEEPLIRIEARKLPGDEKERLGLLPQQSYLHLQFRDNGIGFEPHYEEKVFDVFQRLHGKTEYQGTGIGLAIVKKIMQNHNGAIRAQSTKGEGTTFHLYLPKD
ncbi:PAS domain-containing protein [Maribacter sp. 2307ULW6-5]|uniref:PAS domain-containing sensor histidine kinase n=1 Tax=Maribacter sp. 2307ULW6-5 TaxID=3386275 RepID=UPI0039BD7F7E